MFLCSGTLCAQQSYPSKPVRIVVAWPPGASADTGARLVANKLGESMGQTFLSENRSGASGIVGAEAVARAAPDGYTLLFSASTHASNKAVKYARDRGVFGRPIGQNQGIQFPLARCNAQYQAADLMTRTAAALFDAGHACGELANLARLLTSEACWNSAEECM